MWMTYTQELAATGKMLGGDALQPADTATTVRVRAGDRLTTDGPFAETKEVLGGYYLIDVDGLDEALDVGGPDAEHHLRLGRGPAGARLHGRRG